LIAPAPGQAAYRLHLMRSRDLAELRAMDESALKDSGISRIAIRAAVQSRTELKSGRD
jgi:uncharacterized protein YjiS (DUF1127 family)